MKTISQKGVTVGLLAGIFLMLLIGAVQQSNHVGRYQIAFGKYKTIGYDTMGSTVSVESSYLIKIDTISGKTWEYISHNLKDDSVLKGFEELPEEVVKIKPQKQ